MKVLLIDDHPLILSALKIVVEELGDHVEVGAVSTAEDARAALAADPGFDIALLDLKLADTNGFDFLAELRMAHPALPIVIISAFDSRSDILRAIDMGAMGFVPKRSSNEALLEALNRVLSGGIYVPPNVLGVQSPTPAEAARAEAASWNGLLDTQADAMFAKSAASLTSLGLTARQKEVLAFLLRGQSNKLIARALNLSVETVKDHVAAVLRALNVNSRTQAVVAVSQMINGDAFPGARNAEPARRWVA